MRKLALLLAALAAWTTLSLGCGGYSAPPASPSPGGSPAIAANSVTLSNFSFSPATITIKAGASVTWTNKDSIAHDVASDTGAFDSGNLPAGGTFSYTFADRGSYAYHCTYHPSMQGTVIVE